MMPSTRSRSPSGRRLCKGMPLQSNVRALPEYVGRGQSARLASLAPPALTRALRFTYSSPAHTAPHPSPLHSVWHRSLSPSANTPPLSWLWLCQDTRQAHEPPEHSHTQLPPHRVQPHCTDLTTASALPYILATALIHLHHEPHPW